MSKHDYNALMISCREAANAYRAIFNDDEKTDFDKAQAYSKLDKAISDYNDAVRDDAYLALVNDEKPVEKLVTDFDFGGLKKAKIQWGDTKNDVTHKRISMIEISDAKNEIYDLRILDAYCAAVEKQPFASATWQDKVTDLTRLFNSIEMRASGANGGSKFKCKDADRKDIITTYKIGEEVITSNASDAFKTDVSMASLKKATQDTIDAILFSDNGKGKNTYMVKTEDVMYVFTRVTKYNPKSHRSSTVRAYMFSLLFDVLGKRVAGYNYLTVNVK